MSARPLSNIECLLLSQAVYELGAAPASWPAVAKILSKHPLLSRPKSFWTPAVCSTSYDRLLQEAGLERTEDNNAIKAEVNLKLAKKYYQLRYHELFQLIKDEEAKFKSIFSELEEIRAGKWDARIKSQLTGIPEPQEEAETGDKPQDGASEDAKMETAPGCPESSEEPQQATPDVAESLQDSPPAEGEAVEEVIEDDTNEPMGSPRESVPASDASGAKTEEEVQSPAVEEVNAESEEAPAEEPTPVEDEEATVPESEAMVEETEDQEMHEPEVPSIHVEPEEQKEAEEEAESSGDEPLQAVRRSTRRKSSASSAPPPLPTRGRGGRRQKQPAPEPEPQLKVEEESNENEGPADTPRTDDVPSSPFEPAGARTREGKRKASLVEATEHGGRESKRLREGSEAVDDDDHESPAPSTHNTRSRPTRGGARSEEQVAIKRFQNVIGLLHSQISQHRNGTIFHNPIKLTEAPDYHDIVKKPMDLKTIKARVKDGLITNSLEYQRDIYLMFANAMMYNRPASDVYIMTEDMMMEAERQIQAFRQTEGFVRSGR